MTEDEYIHAASTFRDMAILSEKHGVTMGGEQFGDTVMEFDGWKSFFCIKKPGKVIWYPMAIAERICYVLGLSQHHSARLEIEIESNRPPECYLIYHKSIKEIPIDSILKVIRDGQGGDL